MTTVSGSPSFCAQHATARPCEPTDHVTTPPPPRCRTADSRLYAPRVLYEKAGSMSSRFRWMSAPNRWLRLLAGCIGDSETMSYTRDVSARRM